MGKWLNLARDRTANTHGEEPTELTKALSVGFVSGQSDEYKKLREAIDTARDWQELHDICSDMDAALREERITLLTHNELFREVETRSRETPGFGETTEKHV